MSSTATNRREQLRRQQAAAAKQQRTTRIIGVIAGVLHQVAKFRGKPAAH